MSASLNQLPINMKTSLAILIPLALLVVATTSCLTATKPSKERLIKNLSSQLREEKFAQLYDEADDSVHLNVTKEKFVQRMKTAATKLKAIDENLDFQRDIRMEEALGTNDESISIRAIQKLEKDGKSVVVAFYWSEGGNFFDLWVSPNTGTSEEYRVHGVSYQHLYVGNQMVE